MTDPGENNQQLPPAPLFRLEITGEAEVIPGNTTPDAETGTEKEY